MVEIALAAAFMTWVIFFTAPGVAYKGCQFHSDGDTDISGRRAHY